MRDFTYIDDVVECNPARVIVKLPAKNTNWNAQQPDASSIFSSL
jgi:hypothetical protein